MKTDSTHATIPPLDLAPGGAEGRPCWAALGFRWAERRHPMASGWATFQLYTHGSEVQVQHPERIESIRRLGYETRITGRPGTSNWFHFAIPTVLPTWRVFPEETIPGVTWPSRAFDSVVRLGHAEVRLAMGSDAVRVERFHVWDGRRRIWKHDSIDLSGPSARAVACRVTSDLFTAVGEAARRIRTAIGISIGVRFLDSDGAKWIRFTHAGVEVFEEMSPGR